MCAQKIFWAAPCAVANTRMFPLTVFRDKRAARVRCTICDTLNTKILMRPHNPLTHLKYISFQTCVTGFDTNQLLLLVSYTTDPVTELPCLDNSDQGVHRC